MLKFLYTILGYFDYFAHLETHRFSDRYEPYFTKEGDNNRDASA